MRQVGTGTSVGTAAGTVVAGQLLGAVVLDLFLPAAGDQLSVTTLIGTALALIAVTVIALPGHRRSRVAGQDGGHERDRA